MSIAKAALEAWVREIAARLGPDGHRVNAISAGPIKTLAASGIPGFEGILDHVERNSPLEEERRPNGCRRSSDMAGQSIIVV